VLCSLMTLAVAGDELNGVNWLYWKEVCLGWQVRGGGI
jgi:hypothetical protein